MSAALVELLTLDMESVMSIVEMLGKTEVAES